MKIQSLVVKNFRSLINTEVKDFSRINFFYGYNNSGKSNIFKFLDLLFRGKALMLPIDVKGEEENEQKFRIEPKGFWEGDIYNEPFLFTNNDRDKPIVFSIELELTRDELPDIAKLEKLDLIKDENIVVLEGEITSKDISTSTMELQSAKLNEAQVYSKKDEIESFFPKHKELDRKVVYNILSKFNDIILYVGTDRNFTKELFNSFEGELDSKNFKNWLFELNINSDKNEAFVDLSKFLSKFDFTEDSKKSLQFNIESFPFGKSTSIGFTKFEEEVEIMLHNKHGRFPLSNYGTGIQQFFYLLVKIFWSKSKIVIIEELELNLSPLYQKEILRFLTSLIKDNLFNQLLFSSHSPYFTQKNNFMVDVIHHVEILDNGTHVNSYNDPDEIYDTDSGESLLSQFYS